MTVPIWGKENIKRSMKSKLCPECDVPMHETHYRTCTQKYDPEKHHEHEWVEERVDATYIFYRCECSAILGIPNGKDNHTGN